MTYYFLFGQFTIFVSSIFVTFDLTRSVLLSDTDGSKHHSMQSLITFVRVNKVKSVRQNYSTDSVIKVIKE